MLLTCHEEALRGTWVGRRSKPRRTVLAELALHLSRARTSQQGAIVLRGDGRCRRRAVTMGEQSLPKLDNPAGRLHALLSEFASVNDPNPSLVNVWAGVFGVQTKFETYLALAEAAALIPQIDAAVVRGGDEDQEEAVRLNIAEWTRAILLPTCNLEDAPGRAPDRALDERALSALGQVSSYLSLTASEGHVPGAEEISDLRRQARELIDGIVDDPELPEAIKRLALDHAYRLAEALDHFKVGGPGAVRAATERLAGSLLMAAPEARRTTVWSRVWTFAYKAYAVFNQAPEVADSIEAAKKIYEALPGGGS